MKKAETLQQEFEQILRDGRETFSGEFEQLFRATLQTMGRMEQRIEALQAEVESLKVVQ